MRYGLGWGVPKPWAYIALLNVIWLFVSGVYAIVHMEKTKEKVDDAAPPGDFAFHPDTAFGYGELLCAAAEIAASIYYVLIIDKSIYSVIASTSNVVGWVSVYGAGIYVLATGNGYNSVITQLIFHYAMLVMLWAINELAFQKEREFGQKIDDGEQPNETSGLIKYSSTSPRTLLEI